MADDSALEVTSNVAAFSAALAGLAADLGDLSVPIRDVANTTIAEAAAASPRRSGQMAASHRAGAGLHKGSALITVATVYAAPQHWGWRAHGIARKPWIVATFRRAASWPPKMVDDLQNIIDKQAAKT